MKVCKTEFEFILIIYHIFLLVSLKEIDLAKKKLKSCKSIFNELSKVMKDGRNEKGDMYKLLSQNMSYAPSVVPYVQKHANVLFSFTKAYMAYEMLTYTKCIRLMNTVETMAFSEEEAYVSYQLNNIACCHLRMQKYALASYYFAKALNILQKINKEVKEENSTFKKYETILNLNALQQYPFILHNYGLALLQLEKYDEAAEMYSKLTEYWPDNSRKINSLYDSVLDNSLVPSEDKPDTLKKKSADHLENKENIGYPRYILNTRNNLWPQIEDELSNRTKFINHNSKATAQHSPKELLDCLEKANKCFKNAAMIAKKKKVKYQKDPQVQIVLRSHDSNRFSEDSEEAKTAETNTTNDTEDDKNNSSILKLSRSIKEYQDVLQSSLTYLAYISLSLGEINNTINYAKGCLELNYISDENRYICLMYLVEVYCILGKNKEALSQINTLSLNQVILTSASSVLGVNQAYIIKEISSKVVIYTNLATIHLLNNNIPAAQTTLENALKSLDPAAPQASSLTPTPILNLLVYLNLKLDKPDAALQLLKKRSTVTNGVQKPLLNIVKPAN